MHRIAIALGVAAFLAGAASAQEGKPPVTDPREAFAQTDTNGDGQVDHREFHARMVEIFYFADKDKDGLAVRGEMGVWDEEALFDREDRDGDARISLTEFVAARFEDFDRADTDDSETLTVEEVVAEYER